MSMRTSHQSWEECTAMQEKDTTINPEVIKAAAVYEAATLEQFSLPSLYELCDTMRALRSSKDRVDRSLFNQILKLAVCRQLVRTSHQLYSLNPFKPSE